MGTNTGLGIGIGIPFKNNALGGDRPYLPPELKARLIGVWDNYGKKNTDADRNIIKNKIPNAGGDLEILNAAYEGMSGCNGYPVVFGSNKTWEILSSVYSYTSDVTSTTIHVTMVKNAGTGLLFSYVKKDGALTNIKEIPAFRVTVKGLEGNSKFGYRYLATEDATGETLVYLGNGTHELAKSFAPTEALLDLTRNAWVGIFITPMVEGEVVFDCDITIEVLPKFEGAFVIDGIDDLITSTKTVQEMLGGSNEITVVSMMANLDSRQILCNSNFSNTNGYNVRNTLEPNGVISMLGYTDKNGTTNNLNLIMGDKDSIKLVGKVNFNSDYVFYPAQYYKDYYKVAWYWTIIANKVLTTDEINQVIAYYNLDRTLRPDILCNITKQGITNDNHAEFNDKLIDYSGNGRDIQMNNLAWKGGSGIAAKQYETFKDWTSESSSTSIITQIDEFTRIVESTTNGYWVSRIRRNSDLNKVYDAINVYLYQDNNFLVHECKYEVDGVKYAIPINEPVGKGYHKLEMYTKDRYTELPENAENVVLSEWYFPKSTKGSIKYSIIPSCKGGILLDGINDFGKVIDMPVYKDYTFIIDRQIISIGDTAGVVASKSENSADATKHGAFIFEYLAAPDKISTWSFYKDNGQVANTDFTRGISYQSTYSYNGKDLTIGTSKDSDKLWLGTIRDRDSRFFNGVIYSLMSFPYSMNKFLIERQLKKYKLGTLYPNMVEFRPVIKSSVELVNKPSFAIRGTSTLLNVGDYIPENSEIWVVITMNNAADRITKFVINGNTIDIPSSAYNPSTMKYGFPFTIDSKSPQKITMTIEQDENYVKFEPVITSNVEYNRLDFYLNNYQKRINVGDYIPKDIYVRANFYLKNNVDELTVFTFNGVNINYKRSVTDDTAFNIGAIYNYDSPQEVNITIDEYIRYENIVQPYPSMIDIYNSETYYKYTWGDKLKVGSKIIFKDYGYNLLPNLYNSRFGILQPNGLVGIEINREYEVFKGLGFTATNSWTFDDNEPKSILSPRLLRIPNSSYKLLGYIPDISGHGNHGVIHNSAYAEGSGVNEDGSWQFDGVDDFVDIPTLSSGGKQMLMKVNWDKTIADALLYDQRGYPNEFAIYNADADNNNNPVFAYQARNNGQTYIDGILNKNIKASKLRAITHNITITNELSTGTNTSSPVIGSNRVRNAYFTKMALYDFMLFDNISTDDKILELNEYVGIEAKVELPPYYWDAYGKTNLDADKATIQQRGVAVGNYDLTNYNHAYDKMSGYGGYKFAKFDNELDWYLTPDNGYIDVVSRNGYSITLKNLSTSDYGWYFQNSTVKEFITKDIPFKVKANKSIRVYWDMHSYKSNGENFGYVVNNITLNPNEDTSINLRHLTEEELTELDANKDKMYYLLWFDLSTLAVDEEVTIEMLPLYPNGLLYDGVTDYSQNANIPAFTDYTYIYKRTIINIPTNAATLLKGADKTNGGAFIADYGNEWQFNFGQYNTIQSIVDGINWQTVNSFNGTSINKGKNTDDSGITVAKFSNGYTSMVFYKLILYPKTISLLEINFLKNLMEKDEIIDLNNPIFIKNE